MPENKKYLIEIPGQEGVAYWGEERYNANKDALLKDHPDAIIAEVGMYSAEDARDNDEYIINIPGKSGSAHWDSQRFNANRDNLLKDFPNAQIQRVRPIDYWEEQRTDLNKRLEEHNAQYGSFLSEYEDKREMERARGLMGDTMRNTPESEYILENAREYGIRNKEREALLKALHENPREQQRKQNLHDSIDEMFAALEQEGNDSYKAALNQYIAEGGNIAAPGADAVISDKAENGLYNGALRFLESAKKTLEAPSKFDSSNGFLNFMKGAGHTFGSPDFWTFGLTSIVDNLEARDAFEKIWGKFKTVDINELSAEDIEQMLTPGEKALVEAFTKKAMADAERANDLSLGYQSGMTSAESLGFMAQFILTGGVTSSAAKGATKWAAKGLARGFGNLARQGVSKGMMNAIRGAGKFALGTTRSLIDAAVRTGITTTAPKSISEQLLPNIQQNTLPEANVAILKGLGDAFIENWSESYGGILGSVFKAPMNALFPEWSKAIARTPFMQVAERAGFNGYLTEIGEEWFGNAMRTLTNVDPDALKDFATVDNQIVTMTAFLPMTLIGGGVSMGQRRAAEKDLENKTANLRYTLEKAGLNMDEIDALVDYRQSLSPQMLSDRFTPLINRIAQMPGNRALAAELFKSAGHFSNAVARYQAMEGGYQVEENNAKNELRDEMVGNMNGNRFWNTRQSNATNENGEAYEFDEVQVVTRNDGSRFFIMGQAGDQLSTIDENGAIGYTTEEELNQQFEQGIIASNRTMMLDQFLSEDVIARRREVEAKRMSEQRTTQIDEIRANNPIGTSVSLGTRVNPLAGFVVRYDPERVIIQTENQANPFVSLSYEQFAQALNTPIRVLNDEQMAAEEAALIEAERAERETEQADTPDDMTVAEESTHSAVEFEEEAAPSIIPMNEDGSVDEAKFLEEHPEEYVAWNDNNMQDGGADSREQLQMLIPVYQNMYNEAAKNWAASAANPVARRAAKASMAEWQEKIDRINSILAQYNMPTQENQPLAERTIQAELEDLHDGSLNDNEIISNIDAHIAEAQAAYDEYAKTAPVMGTDRQAYKQAKAEYEEGLKGLQQELDYWNEVKKANERYGQMMQQAEYEAMEVRRIEAIKARIAEIAQRIGAGVNVIERPEDVTEAAAKREIEEGRPPLGWYNVTTGKVDLYLPGIPSAQMAEETIMHEVVGHKGLRGLLGEDSFGGLCDAVWDYMKSSLSKREQDFWLMYPGVNGDTRKAADEYMAHIAESVDFSEDRSVWDKIIGFIKDALRKIGIGAGVNDDYIIDMLKRSYANLRDNAETAPATSEEFLEENGFEVDETNDDIRLSSRYTTTDAQEGELISAIVDVTGRSKDDAERWLQSEKSAASIVLADKQYLDYIPDDRYKAIKDNSDYPQGTVDFNNICRKRVSFTKMFTRLQRRFPNRVFTADDLADIRTIMSNDGLTVACGLCYVEDRRQMVGEVASFFIDQMQKNFEDYTYEVSAKDFAAGKMKRKKLSKDKVKKAAKYVVLIGNDTYVPSVYDLTTLEGLDKLYREHRGIWEAFQAFNSDRGQQSQNLFQGYAEYKREILDWSDAKVKKVNSLGGLRVFSYSDFEAHHLLDLIQIIIDCAARGVMIQGYTKVPEFARAVAQTGIKLNRSLIPLGDTGIVDGKLAFDPIEGIDVNDPNFLESNDNVGNILIGINDEQIRLAMADPFVHYIIPYHARQAEGIRAKLKVGNWSNYIDVQNERNISDGKRVKKGINIYTDVLNESITNDRQFVERYLEVCKEKGYIPKFDQFLNKDSEGNYIYTPGYHKFLVDFKLFDEAGNILPQKPVVAEFDDTFNMQILKDYAKGERVSAGEQMNTTYDKIVEALRLNEEEAEGEDIRFKTAITPKMDAEYMAAVESGDMETAQRMVLEAAKLAMPNTKVVDENGNPKVVYHQTNAKVYVNRETGQNWDELNWKEKMEWDERDDWEDYWEEQDFNTFSRVNARTTNEFDGFFFAPKYDEYHEYGERTIAAFVNIQNPASREDYNIDSRYSDAGRAERIRLQEAGFDGVIRMDGEEVDEYIAFEPSQIKSAEAVAYDDAGNVIPLSERFNPKNEDIRFRVLDTTNAELKEKPIKLNGMYRFKLKNAFKGVKDNGGSYPYIKVQLEEVSEDYSGEKIIYNGILEGFAVIRTPKGLITEGEKENEFFIDPKAIESELWDVLRATENYYEFKHGDAPYQRDWMNVEEVRFRMSNDNQAIFVSNAAKAVEGIKMEKATPEQWLKMIEKNGGLKAGEDKWMGLSDWLKASDKKTLTKAEVLDFVNEHMIVIEEQHYSNQVAYDNNSRLMDEKYPGWRDAFSFEWDDYRDAPNADILDEEEAATLYNKYNEDKVEIDEDGEIVDDTDRNKVILWGEGLGKILFGLDGNVVRPIHDTREVYTTKGLINRHEIALTVPTIESWGKSDMIHFGDAGDGRAVAWIRFGETSYKTVSEDSAAYNESIDALYAYWDYLREKYGNGWADAMTEAEKAEEKRIQDKYKIKRANLRKKVLVIDEIQSKRHQEGREKGYKSKDYWPLRTSYLEKKTVYESLYDEMAAKYGEEFTDAPNEEFAKRVLDAEDYERIMKAKADFDAAADAYIPMRNAIPDAPFDKNWHELAMKRMLRYAAENGYDVIAWTKGEQQAERYGIGKVVSSVVYRRTEDGKRVRVNMRGGESLLFDVDVLGKVTEVQRDGGVVTKGMPLSEIVGSNLANQIGNYEGEVDERGDYNIKSEDFRIGGEGMKGFYDRMLPAFMNKYGKKWGVKVEDIELPNLENGLTMHSVPVTEEMKASVMGGQVMFRMRTEEEDAMEFTQQVINDCTSRYNEVAEVHVFPENEETAERFGYTMEELKEIGGTYVKEEDIIAIFASKDRNDSLTIENIFFHESIHKLAEFYPEFKKIGEWMWNNANVVGLQKIKNHIENGYDSEWYSEEMLTYGIAGAMSLGVADRLESVMPKELQGDYRAILNEIGYEPGKESRRTESRISESSRRGAAAMERKTDESGRSKKEEARTGELTAEERRVIGEYFPEFNKSEDVRMKVNSQGKDLTEGQKEFFANSKAVDKDGNLLVLYHGTPRAGFTEFKSGWFTTSKEDAISYSGDRKGRLFDPNEKYEPETLTAGDFSLGYMTFDSEEDRAAFLAEYPGAENAMSEAEFDSMTLQADEEYDDLMARKPELQQIWKAYREYERERLVDSTIGDLLSNPQAYTEEDFMRAMLAYDSNANFDSLDDMDAAERKDALVSALQTANEETEGGILDMVVPTRVPRNGEGVKHNDLGNRTYEVYANIENPYEIDANGRGSEFESGDIYKAVERALADEQYDGAIIRNWRVGRHQQLGDVVVPKTGSQVKLTSNENPSESSDIRFRTSLELDEEFGDAWRNQQNEDGRHSTQVANTKSTYEKIGRYLEDAGMKGASILDASSGLGLGTQALREMGFQVDDVEPFPSENREAPTFSSYADIDKQYDVVISNAVLNVIPDDWRADVLHQMADAVKEGGKMIINTRPASNIAQQGVEGKTRITLDSPSEILVKRGDRIAAYQKGFTSEELAEWIKSELGEGWRVEKATKKNSGISGEGTAVVIKEGDNVSFRVTGTPTDEVVAKGLTLTPAQTAEVAANIFAALPEESRKKITDGLNGNILGLKDAILQMPTSLAMKSDLTDEEIEAAKVIAQKVEDAIVNSGVELARPLTTDEALWMLYRASNPISESNPFAMAERAVVADHLGFSPKAKEADKVGEDDIRFRKYISYQVASAAEAYSDAVAYWGNRMNEAFVDQFDSVDQMMKAIEEATGKKAETWEDVRLILTQTASKGFAKLQEVEQTLIQKMWDAVNAFANEGVSYERLSRYVILKHGLERNELFAKRDARRSYEEEYHSEVKRIKNDPTLTDAEKQQQMDDAKVVLDNHIADINAQTDARYLENRKTDYSGIRAMFADYPGLMSSDNYNTEEEYRTARRKARKLRYKKLDYAEAEAQMECDDFEAGRGALVKDLWDSINNLTKGTLKMQYDYGMLSSETYKNLTGMFKYYVPLRGFSDNTGEDLYDYYSHNTSDGYAPAVIGAKGRKSEAESPFGWMAAMAATAIVSGEKNAAKQALYYFVMNRRANDLLKVADVWYVQSPSDADTYYPEFPPMADPNKTTAENAQQYADWENQMEDLRRQGKAVKKTNRLDIAGVAKFGAREVPEHIIKVNIAGEEKQLILNANPRAAQAINGLLNIEGNPDYQKVLGKILRWMSQVSTGWNPEFWMTNISRDTITAFSAVGIKEDKIYNEAWRKNWVEAWKIVKLLPKLKDGTLGTGRLEDLLREAVENGVQTGYSHIKSMEEWDKDMNKYLKELNKDEAKVVRAIKKGIDKVQTFSESMELVSRFATYLTSRQMGRDIVRSVADAKEVTVNFNRKGSGMRITFDEAKKLKWADGTPIFSEKWKGSQRLKGLLSVAYVSGISALAPFGRKYMMFFNAGIQGVNMWLQMYRKGYGRQVNTLAGAAFALGMLNSIIQGILDGDDNEYQESISDYERRSNFMIGAKGYYVKIALPQELKAFYGLADILYNYGAGNYHHKDTPVEVLKTMTNQLMEIMPINPMGGWQEFIPSFATATIEAGVAIPFLGEPIKGTNKNFAGSPLRDEKPWLSDAERESMPKYAFASNNTWNWLVDLAELANRATGGTKYDAGWLQLDPARIQHYTEQATGGIGGFVGKLTSTINAVFDSEKDVEIANIPFLNKMFTVADERSKNKLTNQQFYYYKGVAEAAEMRYSNYSKEGDKDSRKKERGSDEYKIMKIYYKYDGREEMYRNKLKRARTSTEEKEIKAKRDASRKEFINELADKGLL